jgi:PAS domain S-box-containing protein
MTNAAEQRRAGDGARNPAEIRLGRLEVGKSMLGSTANRDITVRKRAEGGLRGSEIRYQRLFKAAQDGILILDCATGKVLDVNPFLTNLLGYSHAELVGKELWEIGTAKDISASRLSFADLQTKWITVYDDLPLETRDCRQIAVEFVSTVYTADGTLVIQCNIRDITPRKSADKAPRRSEEQLQQAGKLEAVGRLAGGVAHDFNKLLSVILGSSELLLNDLGATDPPQKKRRGCRRRI